MSNIYKSNDLGGWKTTMAAALRTLDSSGEEFGQSVPKIYGNGRHTAIIELRIELGDADGNLLLENFPTIDAVLRSVELGDYDDTNGFSPLGAGATLGWAEIDRINCFMCPLLDSGKEPIVIDSSIYKNKIKDGIAYIYFFLAYSKEGIRDEVSCSLGVKITPGGPSTFPAPKTYYISKTHRDNGDPIGIAALPPLKFTPNDFVWAGTHLIHTGENDEFSPGT